MTTLGKAAQAYQQIERMIVFQQVEPGSLISESHLMERTGLGRTPVREALQLLSRNRMVEIHPNKGVLIPPTSVEAQLRMLELRRELETLAVRLASQRSRDKDRAEMLEMVETLSSKGFTLEEYADTIKGTHELIVTGAHNEYLADAMAPLQGLSRRFWLSHIVDEAAEIQRGTKLHVAILKAILNSDASAAETASESLNDYLIEFTYASLGPRSFPG